MIGMNTQCGLKTFRKNKACRKRRRMTLIKVLDFERQLVKWSGSGQTGGFSDREMERKG